MPNPKCPRCGGKTIKDGSYRRDGERIQRYYCKACNYRPSEDRAPKVTQEKWQETGKDACGSVNTAIKPRTIKDAAKLFQVNLDIWEAEKMVVNSWDVTNKKGVSKTNYQVKVWFKKKTNSFKIEEVCAEINSHVIPRDLPQIKYKPSGGLLEINSADLHFGKLAWGEETGENYDFHIATDRFNSTLQDAIEKGKLFGIGQILFVVGNDFFNADNSQNQTAKGTPVDSDLRWQKRFTLGCKLLVNAVATLRNHAPVKVMVIPGNHDDTTMFYAGTVLETTFQNTQGVSIDNQPKPRKYFYWNKNLIGFAHGHKGKPADMLSMMINEASNYTGVYGAVESAITKEFHLGHLHHEIAKDYNGLVVRWVKSPTGTDAWHNQSMFTGSVKGIQSFLYTGQSGLEANFHSNVILEKSSKPSRKRDKD